MVDLATAAQTIPQLQTEIAVLDDLIGLAHRVRAQGDDKKWVQLRAILDEQLLEHRGEGEPRKVIVFTEHRDTLEYLRQKIGAQFGRADAVITIHGGTQREDRKAARERFTHHPDTVVLLATDAAGEGLNLQRAHLMVNYDLPWNPNRIEQRFGRIHRIGQREVCHLWNMVAKDTREGEVFARLLTKIEQMSLAYNGNLFNVLGEGGAFQERSLRELLIEAIRYGDRPETKAKLDRIIDAGVSEGLGEMVAERALHPEMFSALDLDEVRRRMELARERRLQPGYIRGFFTPAFERLGGRIREREKHRFEITRVPTRVMELARRQNRLAPVVDRYERVTFDLAYLQPPGLATAALIAPGHPLLHAVIEATLADLAPVLKRGTVFVDRRETQADGLALLYAVEQRIDGALPGTGTVSHHLDYPMLSADGTVTGSAVPPYLDSDRPEQPEAAAIAEIVAGEWVRSNHERAVRAWAYREGTRPRIEELETRISAETARTRAQVKDRLLAEINHWDREHTRLEAQERAGKIGRLRAETALARSRQLEDRLARRLAELDAATRLVAEPSVIRGTALVVPSRMIAALDGGADRVSAFAVDDAARREVERRAVEAVLAAERALGREPVEMVRNNPGFDIRSTDAEGFAYFIEVKGRIEGADTFTITGNEVSFAQSQRERHRLALVWVSPLGAEHDQLRYVLGAFAHIEPSVTTRSFNEEWRDYWAKGGEPR